MVTYTIRCCCCSEFSFSRLAMVRHSTSQSATSWWGNTVQSGHLMAIAKAECLWFIMGTWQSENEFFWHNGSVENFFRSLEFFSIFFLLFLSVLYLFFSFLLFEFDHSRTRTRSLPVTSHPCYGPCLTYNIYGGQTIQYVALSKTDYRYERFMKY